MKKSIASCVAGSVLLLTPFSINAQASGECDVKLTSITAPKKTFLSPSTSIPITLNVGNPSGIETEGVSARVSLNDKVVFTEPLGVTLPASKWKATTVTLGQNLDLEPGNNYKLTVELLPPEGFTDTDTSNNTASVEFSSPSIGSYPVEWNASAAPSLFHATSGYEWDSTEQAFTHTGNGWSDHQLHAGVLNIPAGEKANFALRYKTSGQDFTLTATAITASAEIKLATVALTADAGDYTLLNIPFEGLGEPMIIAIKASPRSTTLTGTVSFTAMSVTPDTPDLACAAIINPANSHLAAGAPVYVKARFDNLSGLDITNPQVSYTFGDMTVNETINATIAPQTSYEYTFATPLEVNKVQTGTLTVSCSAAGDSNKTNDSAEIDLDFYQAANFPYTSDINDIDQWTIVNADNDLSYWVGVAMTATDRALYYPAAKKTAADYAFTPAIAMPAGKSRLSFYLGGTLGSRVRVLTGTSMNPDEMDVLTDTEIQSDGWFTVATTFDVKEAGIRYFAFECVSSMGEIFIDNVYIDRGNDLAVAGLSFDTTSGFKKTSAKVSISITNFGIDPQSDIEVAYYLSNNGTNNFKFVKSETITATINPGETYSHTFAEPLDISTPGTSYDLMGEILTKVGPDSQNDRSLGESLSHYSTLSLPYSYSFEDAARNAQWTMLTPAGGLAWTISSLSINANEGNYLLGHSSTNATQQADEWAFSECIHIPAGQYEFSMFYRTYKNMNADAYKQNFKVCLGSEASPESMNVTITDMQDVIVSGSVYKKLNIILDIEREADYYLGFHNSSPTGYGVTYIDDIAISPVSGGISCDYSADFQSDGWDIYYTKQKSWGYSTTEAAMVMERSSYYSSIAGSAGWLVSPKLAMEAGKDHIISLEYALSGNEADNPALGIYYATVNNPDEFTLIKTLDPSVDYTTATCTLPAFSEATGCYIAVRPAMDSAKYAYTAKLKAFSVTHDPDQSGIGSIAADGSGQATEAARYDISGRRVSDSYKGIVIIRMTDGSVRKTLAE